MADDKTPGDEVVQWLDENASDALMRGRLNGARCHLQLREFVNEIIRREVSRALGADAATPWHISHGHDAEEA